LDFDSDDDMGADEVAIISWRGILEMLADGTSDESFDQIYRRTQSWSSKNRRILKSSSTSNSLVSEFAHYLNMTAFSSIRGNLNHCGRAFEQTALMGRAIRSDARICRLALSSEAVVISGVGGAIPIVLP